jgi:itaconate CoA-transferase
MFDTIVEWMAVPFLHAAYGRPPKRIGLAHPSIAPYGVFSSREGRPILISIQNEREWVKLCEEVLGPDMLQDGRFSSNVDRVKNRTETDARVAAAFAALDTKELVHRLSKADIAFAFVNEVGDLLGHSQLHTVSVNTPNGAVELPTSAGARAAGSPCQGRT